MSKRVLLAVGDKAYTEILKETFLTHSNDFLLCSQEVLHWRYLQEIVEIEEPDIIVIHDYYLESSFTAAEEKNNELITFIRNTRIRFDESIRIIFMCERRKGDPLLATLVSLGVSDIFTQNKIDLDKFIEQIKEKPLFSNVEKYLETTIPVLAAIKQEEAESEEVDEKEVTAEKPVVVKQVVQKVVEKKVVQKVVQKNVIKHDFNIHVHNQVEKFVGVPIRRKTIMIGSSSSRAGSTFVSHLLARSISKLGISVSYIESPFIHPYTYDRFFGEEYVPDYRSKFNTFFSEGRQIGYKDWEKDGVEILCQHPLNDHIRKENVTLESFIKVLYSTNSIVSIVDVGNSWSDETTRDLIDITDHIYLMIEPDVSLIQRLEEDENLRELLQHEKTQVIGNRFDEILLQHPLVRDIFRDREKLIIPNLGVSEVFQAQYQGIFLNDVKECRQKLDEHLQPILQHILPSEILQQQKKKGIFQNIFNKKVTIERKESGGK